MAKKETNICNLEKYMTLFSPLAFLSFMANQFIWVHDYLLEKILLTFPFYLCYLSDTKYLKNQESKKVRKHNDPNEKPILLGSY